MNEKNAKANEIIWGAASTAAIAGAFNPVPFAGDIAILITTWVVMLGSLASVYNTSFNESAFRVAAWEALKSAGLYVLGTLSFIYALKFTGMGTLPAALANATLNFGFTMGVGFMYKKAWRNNAEPDTDEMEKVLKEVVEVVKVNFSKEGRARILEIYNDAKASGDSKKDALQKVFKFIFEDEFGEE